MISTRKQVASQAGVSEATVSHVLNNTKFVSPELTNKVQAAIKDLGYQPNLIARSLVTKVTNHVAILVDDIKNPYYGEITEEMSEVAYKNGYIVSLISSGNMNSELIQNLISRKVEGVFFANVSNISIDFGKIANQFKKYGIATVNGSPCVPPVIIVDYLQSIDTMIRYLYDLGHRKIGFLSGIPIDEYNQRYTGYISSLTKYKIPVNNDFIIAGEYPYNTNFDDGYKSMKKLLAAEEKVTAVFTINDLMAFGAMKAIQDSNLRIPEDISVIGCDDIFFAKCASPALSTIRTPKKEIGKQAMYLLLDQINNRPVENVVLQSEFIIRQSTGPAKK